jgi:glycosyltransferase involved in cell wall biosynthesis
MPAEIAYRHSDAPEVSIVIPSLDGTRGGNVKTLIDSLKAQTVKNIEIIISKNERPNGHARNVGIAPASPSSRWYAFFDDDVRLGDDKVLENLRKAVEDPGIGLAGVSQLPPPESSWKQKWIGYDLGKAKFPVQETMVDTEMATHAGMACRREVWEQMGGETETLVTGTDTDLRDRLRKAGYRVVVVPRTWVFHPLPDRFSKVLQGARFHGRYQLDYRKVHGFQRGFLKPFRRIGSGADLALSLAREALLFLPHVFVANRRPMVGFRPLNALFRLFMVWSYSLRAYREG